LFCGECDKLKFMGFRRSLCQLVTLLGCACVLGGCMEYSSSANPQASAPPFVQFVAQWGAKGDGPGQLDEPASIATDLMGNAYIADSGSEFIQKFGPDGTPLLAFQEGGLKHPQGIALDHGGGIYATDPSRSVVYIFKPSGERYRVLHLRARSNAENEISVGVGADGMIHVFDSIANTVYTFTPRMRLIHKWQPAEGVHAAGMHLGPLGMGPDGFLYIADEDEGKILRFTDEGRFDTAYSVSNADGTLRRLSREFAVSINDVFAMDADGVTLHVWTTDGKWKMDADLSSELGHESHVPPLLAFSSRGELLALDPPQDRVLRYHINF
jgi:hypothetical protein